MVGYGAYESFVEERALFGNGEPLVGQTGSGNNRRSSKRPKSSGDRGSGQDGVAGQTRRKTERGGVRGW